ncbi:PD40 domain-containing protein [Rhodanobacter sp. DHG33]|uniref:TolB family protein n=1 Tax=Rhodanobacter sp. DHG33 TaxID=2775921 RepID=UPI0017857449|nr:PD40 domain-containing protein [Rhodanobacter sp. DHG33]MBD8900175.1 PD40 domain-containing protein [Rhodanobacter sp. DHG33]
MNRPSILRRSSSKKVTTFGLALFVVLACASPLHATERSIRNVTDDPTGVDYGPHFSPDGRFLIFDHRMLIGGGRWMTYIVPFEGGTPKPLSTGEVPVQQARTRWSPKGDLIAFTGLGPGGVAATWLMDSDGSHIRRAPTPRQGSAFYPSWYPDGRHILETVGDDNTLRSVDTWLGDVVKIDTTPALMVGMASVSPDGKWIAVAAQPRQGRPYDQRKNQIWLIDGGGHAHLLIESPHQGRAPSWSPDGAKVVFESNEGSPNPAFYAIFVVNSDGSGLKQLTPFERNTQHPVFSPDGKWIAFSERTPKLLGAHAQSIAVMSAP